VGFELVEVLTRLLAYPDFTGRKAHNLDSLVVFTAFIRLQVVVELLSVFSDVSTLGCFQVTAHSVVVREERGGGSDLGTHVTDSGHTGTRKRLDTWTMVLDDSTGTTLDSQDTRNLANNV
jgi:hypothetical protein